MIQLVSGASTPADGGGVAFWAPVGGFVAGVALSKLFENPVLVQDKKSHVKLSPFEIENRGWW